MLDMEVSFDVAINGESNELLDLVDLFNLSTEELTSLNRFVVQSIGRQKRLPDGHNRHAVEEVYFFDLHGL